MGEDCREENVPQPTGKYSGGAIIPPLKKSSVPSKVNANVIKAEPIVSGQPSRKYRKVAVPEEPALDAEELQVLKAFKSHGLIQDDEDEDSLDGFLEIPLWEAKADTNSLYIEEEPEPQGSLMGSYYDSMFGNAGSYDSNFAYGTDLISDAEVLTALGYPQPPPQPSSRASVLCYCGCRINPSEAHKHQHECMPRQGIFAMPCATPMGNLSAPRNQHDDMMSEPQEEPICTVIGGGNEDNMIITSNNNTNSNMPMITQSNDMMTPMNISNGWDGPIQSGLIQSAPPGMSSGPFHVPDTAPVARPRMYRPFMPNIA